VWAPTLAWIALHALPSPSSALKIYDDLRLRHVLAETFSAVGIHGEDAWRAAAQVRVLLRMNIYASRFVAVHSDEFWKDDDVRWLTGIHGAADGTEEFDPQSFTTFVCWLQLPALIDVAMESSSNPKAEDDVTVVATNLAYAAKISSYDCERFLDFLHAEDKKDKRSVVEKPLSAPSDKETVV
jgi:hypothetical protein